MSLAVIAARCDAFLHADESMMGPGPGVIHEYEWVRDVVTWDNRGCVSGLERFETTRERESEREIYIRVL